MHFGIPELPTNISCQIYETHEAHVKIKINFKMKIAYRYSIRATVECKNGGRWLHTV